MFWLSDGEEIMMLAFFVLIQYRSVTGGRTDGQTDIAPLAIPAVCIARYANALVKTRQSIPYVTWSCYCHHVAQEIDKNRQCCLYNI